MNKLVAGGVAGFVLKQFYLWVELLKFFESHNFFIDGYRTKDLM